MMEVQPEEHCINQA